MSFHVNMNPESMAPNLSGRTLTLTEAWNNIMFLYNHTNPSHKLKDSESHDFTFKVSTFFAIDGPYSKASLEQINPGCRLRMSKGSRVPKTNPPSKFDTFMEWVKKQPFFISDNSNKVNTSAVPIPVDIRPADGGAPAANPKHASFTSENFANSLLERIAQTVDTKINQLREEISVNKQVVASASIDASVVPNPIGNRPNPVGSRSGDGEPSMADPKQTGMPAEFAKTLMGHFEKSAESIIDTKLKEITSKIVENTVSSLQNNIRTQVQGVASAVQRGDTNFAAGRVRNEVDMASRKRRSTVEEEEEESAAKRTRPSDLSKSTAFERFCFFITGTKAEFTPK